MKTETPKTDAILSRIPGGQTCDPQLVADELRGPIAEMERELQAWQTEISKVMPPDFKDWWENSKAEWPLVARLVIEGKNRRAEQLERELGSPTDSPDANTTEHARINWWKDRCDDLNEQLAAAKEGAAAEFCRLNRDLTRQSEQAEHHRVALVAERALADRLALILDDIRYYDGLSPGAKQPVTEALAAWKDSRNTETKDD